MEADVVRLIQDPYKSFIVYHETKPFTKWHHHPEYELCYINKGRGKRMIGDNIDRFEEKDLVLVGPHLSHEWLCDKNYYLPHNKFIGEGIVIQFKYDFLGPCFFDVPENEYLKKLLQESSRGIKFLGKTRQRIGDLMKKSVQKNRTEQLYTLFSIFRIMAFSREYQFLSSPELKNPFINSDNQPMQKVLEFIHQNFQNPINVNQILNITNMSNTSFCQAFKTCYRMTFKKYLNSIRIGYACRLLEHDTINIAQVAYNSGFENISFFNRQFKKIKQMTPREYKKAVLLRQNNP